MLFFFLNNLPSQIVLVYLLWICMCISSKLSFRTSQIVPYKKNLIIVLGNGLLEVLLPIDNMNITTPCLALCCYTSPILSEDFIIPQHLLTPSSKGQNTYHTTPKCHLTWWCQDNILEEFQALTIEIAKKPPNQPNEKTNQKKIFFSKVIGLPHEIQRRCGICSVVMAPIKPGGDEKQD